MVKAVASVLIKLDIELQTATREKSYLRASKNIPSNRAVAVSRVGGSPTQLA